MKTTETTQLTDEQLKVNQIIENIENDKELKKGFKKINEGRSYPTTAQEFLKDAERYIGATRERRMFCIIQSVSSSGMSRNLKFNSCERGANGNYWFCNYWTLFKVLGFRESKWDGFRVDGCGMDMVFHTHYTIIHKFRRLGLLTDAECETLAQMTPTYF